MGRAGADWLAVEGVAAGGVPGVVSVKADMGVLCLLEDLRSRAPALPVPFLDAGAIAALFEGVPSVSDRGSLFGRGPGGDTKRHAQMWCH